MNASSPNLLPSIPNYHDLLAFSYWKISAIFNGVHERAKQGNASSKRALELGKAVPHLIKLAHQELGEKAEGIY